MPATDTTTKYVFFYVLHYACSAYWVGISPLLWAKIGLASTAEDVPSSPMLDSFPISFTDEESP